MKRIHRPEMLEDFKKHEKMNIAIFNDNFYPTIGGSIEVCDRMATALQKYANVVVVTADTFKDFKDDRPYPVIRCNSVHVSCGGGNYVPLPRFDPSLKRLLKKLKIDIYHTHSYFGLGKLAVRLAKSKHKPCIVHDHSQLKQEYKLYFKNPVFFNIEYKSIMNLVFNKATEVWAVSNVCKNVLTYEDKCKRPIRIMKNSTDIKANQFTQEEIVRFKKENNITDQNVFLYLSRMDARVKNIFLLLEAVRYLKDTGLKFKLLMVGDGPDLKRLKTFVKLKHLEEYVDFKGMVKDRLLIAKYFAIADLLVFPSMKDSGPLIKYEAASQKTAGLFIENTSSSEDIIDGVNGFLCVNDAQKFAERMQEIVENKKRLKVVSENALKTLYKNWDLYAEQAYNIYQNLLLTCKKPKASKKEMVANGNMVYKNN